MKDKEEKTIVKEPLTFYGENYTYADYLKFEIDEMLEIIRGKVFRMSHAPSTNHQRISGNLHVPFRAFLKDKKCEVFLAPFDVILPMDNKRRSQSNTVVQPDLCIVCDASKIELAGCFGAPDLVVEILSPHTSKKDIENKYSVYEEAGVREYWTIFPGEEVVVIYLLEDGKYERFKAFGKEDELYSSIFPELKLNLSEIFPEQIDQHRW